MKKAIKWIKTLSVISMIGALLTITVNFPYNASWKFEFLIVGLANIIVDIGLYKLKKWGLYGKIILIIYGASASLFKFVILRGNYFTVPIGGGTYVIVALAFFVGLVIFYKVFWKNRKLFT